MSNSESKLTLDAIKPDAPLRLDVAAALAFPDGSMTASGLRGEARKERLVIERIAGKDYTTLAAIERMRGICRVEARDRACGSKKPGETRAEKSLSTRSGASSTADASSALALARAKLAMLTLPSPITSSGQAPRERGRDPAQVKVADVISIYADDVVARHARPKETAARLSRILDFFGGRALAFVNAKSCADYVTARGHQPAARPELEDFRAAVKHHWKAGLCSGLTPVVLPEKSVERERWLTRDEAARLLWAAWRLRQKQFGKATERATAKHVARFILAGLYTGTRAGAICGAAMRPSVGRGHLDIENGVFYRRASGTRQTKKRQPPIRIPPRFLAHCRRWARLGIAHVALVEWNGKPVKRINKAFRAVRAAAGLGADVVPHTLRHTAVTWQAQEGVPAHQICGFFGISFEVFDRVYGHHHPDHQAEAVNALSRPRMKSERLTATERERRGANVVKLHENH